MAWRGAIVLIVMALLAWQWFIHCPVLRGVIVAFVIISCSPSGVMMIVREQAAALGSLIAFPGHGAIGLGPRWLG